MKKFVGDKWEHDDYGNIYTHIDNNRKNIACTWHSEHSPEESQANTRLIAAAPEMYDLLDNIYFYITEIDKLCSSSQIPFSPEFVDYANRIKYLLARINGNSSEIPNCSMEDENE